MSSAPTGVHRGAGGPASSVRLLSIFKGLGWALAWLIVSTAPARAAPTDDRWLELDLYWFSADQPERSAAEFWNRYRPLFAEVKGYRGVVLNLGMTVDYVMQFRGEPDQPIPLPKGTGQEIGVKLSGPLLGDTAQRQKAWRERFRAHENAISQVGYGPWTYGGLKTLAAALRREGARRGVPGFRVATLATGTDGAYGEMASFAVSHPEAWTKWSELASGALASSSHFDANAKLRADASPRAGFPKGWAEGTLVSTAFSRQWGSLSRDTGLDGIMLRDSFSYPRGFTRYGPWGADVPDMVTAERTTEGIARLIRETKQANPRALIMMWSTAATATSDWRANGIDLETIAEEGYLDIFVDQTWAGAWGEVGVRQQTYWNAPILGWTYQLAYMMQHAAVLAKSKVRHYFLAETFDAWESWDTIHTAPERLRWGIWAFSHVAVKTPRGLRMPAGAYVGWGNHGRDLLSNADVSFLARELGAAAHDAAQTREVFGPTVVYSREAMQPRAPADRKSPALNRIDEQIGTLIKWPLPILSITRIEWLDEVRSDLFVFGSLANGDVDQSKRLARAAARGQAMAFLDPSGLDPWARDALGARTDPHRPPVQDRALRATAELTGLPLINVPSAFDAPPTPKRNEFAKARSVYAFGDSTALARRKESTLDLVAWDPPPIADYWYRPLRDNLNGDPAPFILATALLTSQLADRGAPRATVIDGRQAVAFSAWRGADKRIRLLLGNLEEGLRDDAEQGRRITLSLPASWQSKTWTDDRNVEQTRGPADSLSLNLAPYASRLVSSGD